MPNMTRDLKYLHTALRTLLFVGLLVVVAPAHAQRYPERREVRKGNRAFEREQYDGSIERYRRAMSLADSCWEAAYNLGNALYKREMRLLEQDTLASMPTPQAPAQSGEDTSARFDEAVELLERAATDSLRTPLDRAEAYYNLGGVRFAQQKLEESLKSLRNSLRLNPQDEDAKFNYTYVKRLLEQQQQNRDQQQQGGGEENEQQDQNQQQNQQNQQDNQQQNDPQQQDNNPQEQPQEPQEQQPQEPREGMISPQEQEQMLEAIQAQEDETQEKLKEKRGVVIRGTKNW